MNKKILYALLMSAAMVFIPAQTVSADTIGDQIYDNNAAIKYIHDNMSYYLAYDTELRDGTVISVKNEKGDIVPDGKGPKASSNKLVLAVENPISLGKRGYRATYSYSDEDVTLPALSNDYYTFLGWNNDYSSIKGAVGSLTVTDTSSLVKNVVIEKGTSGSQHYTAYWRQNLLNILLNAGTDYKGAMAKNIGTSVYTVDDEGLISKNGTAKFTAQGSEGKISVETPVNIAALNLQLPDYHIEPGKEWRQKDGTIVAQGKDYLTTEIAPEIKDGDATRILYANWVPNVYTVTYNFGKIASESTDTSIYKPGFSSSSTKNSDGYEASATGGSYNGWTATQRFTYETDGALPVPTMKDYQFEGWFTSGGKQVTTWQDIVSETKADNRSTTITARWKVSEFTITYNFDKNKLPDTIAVDTAKVAPSMKDYEVTGTHNSYSTSEKYTVEKKGNLPSPKRDFYNFEGWYFGDKKISTYKEYIDLSKSNRNATIKAAWSPVKYTITYVYDQKKLPTTLLVDNSKVAPKMSDPISKKAYTVSGSHNSYTTAVNYTVQNVDVLPTPERSYYKFGGWQLDGNTITNYKEFFNGTSSHTGKVTGIWTPIQYSIKYTTDTRDKAPKACKDSISLSSKAISKYTVETARQDLNKPTMKGYTFKGWKSSTNKKEILILSELEPLGNATLSAVWTPVNYKITWDNKGNRTAMVAAPTNKNITTFNAETYLDATKSKFSAAASTGYTFVSWKNSSGTVVKSTTDLPLSDVKIKAEWKIIDYTITFKSADIGADRWKYASTTKTSIESTMKSKNYSTYNIETKTFSLNNPSMTHEKFTGWSGSGSGTSVSIAKGSTGNKTFTANWQQTHTYNAYVVDTRATCTADGKKHRDCKYCGSKARETVTIKARKHNLDNGQVTSNSSCTVKGNKRFKCKNTTVTDEYAACSYYEDKALNLASHNYEWKVTKESTCTELGSKAYACKACGHVSQTESIALKAHERVDVAHTHDPHSCNCTLVYSGSTDTGWIYGDVHRYQVKQSAVNVMNQKLSDYGIEGVSYSADEFADVGWQGGQWTGASDKYGTNGYASTVSMYLHGNYDGSDSKSKGTKQWHSIASMHIYKVDCNKTIDYYYCRNCGQQNY